MVNSNPVILIVAGSDSSGGAGVQRDWQILFPDAAVRTVITAVTAQSDSQVLGLHSVPTEMVAKQIQACLADGSVNAIKIGLVGQADVAETLCRMFHGISPLPIVVDPVLMSSSGHALSSKDFLGAFVRDLCPLVSLVTPNFHEAASLLSTPLATSVREQAKQAELLEKLLGCSVLLKGGHGHGESVVDVLASHGTTSFMEVDRRRGSPRGTGCALSSRIALELARDLSLVDACRAAQREIACLWE